MNFYKLEVIKYNQFLYDNIIKIYKKVEYNLLNKIDVKVKIIIEKFCIDDCVEMIVIKEVFIILKDYKDNFENKLMCRLINLLKQEIGKISK